MKQSKLFATMYVAIKTKFGSSTAKFGVRGTRASSEQEAIEILKPYLPSSVDSSYDVEYDAIQIPDEWILERANQVLTEINK